MKITELIKSGCKGWNPTQLREALLHLNRDYLHHCGTEEISDHLNLSQTLTPRHPVHLRIMQLDSCHFKIVIVAYDYFSTFSIFCGLITSFSLNVEDGSVQTLFVGAGRKKIIDLFVVKLTKGMTFDQSVQTKFKTALQGLVGLLEARRFREARKQVNHRLIAMITHSDQADYPTEPAFSGLLIPIEIRFDNHHSKQWTILTIDGKDTPAFLYAFSNALAMRNIYIHKIKISLFGNTIHNRLYISNRQGKKISNKSEQKALRISAILIKQFIHFLSVAPDPMKALTHFDQFLDKILEMRDSDSLFALLKKKETMKLLARFFGTSDFLWEDFLRIRFDRFFPILEHLKKKPMQVGKKKLIRDLHRRLRSVTDYDKACTILNHFKDEEMFRIDMCHMFEARYRLEDFSAALSELAEVVIQVALKISQEGLKEQYGQAMKPGLSGKVASFVICGLGKFGGKELGYASDIELLFIYECNGQTNGSEVIENKEYFKLLTQKIIDLISARQKGIFAIDTRLRPHGDSGPITFSFSQFRKYYDTSGKAAPFERQALIKLRQVAGSQFLGKKCESARDRFVYSGVTWDRENAIELRTRQMNELVGKGQINVKYSAGGLVDIEYLCQYLQIIYGPGRSVLQTSNTLDALSGFSSSDILPKALVSDLRNAYLFIRKLIDALRMVRGNSRDLLLPDQNSEEFVFLSRRMGFSGLKWEEAGKKLAETIRQHMEKARYYYREFVENESLNGSATTPIPHSPSGN